MARQHPSVPETALIVDDEAGIRRSLHRILTASGVQVTAAANLSEARRLLATHRFDAALVDQNLPDGLGSELLREMWRDHPSTTRILITGGTDLNVALKAVNNGELHQFCSSPFGRGR